MNIEIRKQYTEIILNIISDYVQDHQNHNYVDMPVEQIQNVIDNVCKTQAKDSSHAIAKIISSYSKSIDEGTINIGFLYQLALNTRPL